VVLKRYYDVLYKLDELSSRERIMVFIMGLCIILFLWHFLLYNPQVKQIEILSDKQAVIDREIKLFSQRKQIILEQVNDGITLGLINEHQNITGQIKELEQRVKTYQQQLISPRQLSTLLKEMLSNAQNISILEFSTIDGAINKSSVAESAKKSINTQSLVKSKYYKLVLKGNYFSIRAYLDYIEKLNWQIYWNSLEYKVDKYPNAIVEIKFYTLSATDG
jgi:MSHA biogenesis protein MshJ